MNALLSLHPFARISASWEMVQPQVQESSSEVILGKWKPTLFSLFEPLWHCVLWNLGEPCPIFCLVSTTTSPFLSVFCWRCVKPQAAGLLSSLPSISFSFQSHCMTAKVMKTGSKSWAGELRGMGGCFRIPRRQKTSSVVEESTSEKSQTSLRKRSKLIHPQVS